MHQHENQLIVWIKGYNVCCILILTVLVKEKLLNDDEKLAIISNKEENEPEDEHSYKTFSKPELKVRYEHQDWLW